MTAAQPHPTARSPRTASLLAGIALTLMAVLSAFGIFGVITPLIAPGDAAKTAKAIHDSEALFRLGIASMVLVTVLDIIVASALYTLFALVNRNISMVAAWFRVAYAAVFLVSILQLLTAVTLMDDPPLLQRATAAFFITWYTSLILFGVHLLLIGYLAYRSGFMARIFGILLVVAGLGYLADGFGVVLIPGFTTIFGRYLFVGEVAFIFWLLIKGRRLLLTTVTPPSTVSAG